MTVTSLCKKIFLLFIVTSLCVGVEGANAATKKAKFLKAFNKKGLSVVPSAEKALKVYKKKSTSSLGISAVVGTPPAISEVGGMDVTTLFWEEGDVSAIASGTASNEQCGRFWDGMGACQMLSNVGYSFAEIKEADTSLCYMQKIPTQANYNAGAISLISGTLPGGKVSQLFVPGESTRVVKVNISGSGGGEGGPEEENVFIKVFSKKQNESAGRVYGVDLWFCGEQGIRGYNKITIKNDGKIQSVSANQQQQDSGSETFISKVTGYLDASDSGTVAWDNSKARLASIAFLGSNGSFKSDLKIDGSQLISKSVDTWGGQTRKTYNISTFAGSGLSNVALKEGAFKGEGEMGNYGSATQYQTPRYVSAEGSDLQTRVQSYNISSDSFYSSEADPELVIGSYSCDPEVAGVDIEVAVDMSNSSLQGVASACETPHNEMNFCFENEQIRAAQEAFGATCIH